MLKIVRNTILILLALVIVLMIALFVIANRIDPNDYKPQIVDQTKSATGLELRMDGDIAWKFFPSLAIQIADTEAHTEKSYAGDTRLAKISSIDVQVNLMPLLSGQVVVDKVLLDGVQLRLATDKKGHSNWKDIEAQDSHVTYEHSEYEQESTGGSSFVLNNFQLNNIKLELIDQSTNTEQSLAIETLTAEGVNLNGKGFPLDTKIIFEDKKQGQAFTLELASRMALDSQASRYELSEFNGSLDKSSFNGNAQFEFGKQTRVVAALNIDQINLNDYIDFSAGAESGNASSKSGEMGDLPLDILHTLNTGINLTIGKLIADKTQLDTVKLAANIDNGRLDVKELSARVYNGSIVQSLQVDANHNPARWKAKQTLSDIDVSQLLTSRDIDVSISGLASLNSSINTRGNALDSLQQNLSGKTSFNLTQGVYGDDNIELRICQAIALARNKALSKNWPAQTTLNNIEAQVQWNEGIGKITQINAGLPNASIKGDGSINLIKQALDLRLRANVSGDANQSLASHDPACAINERYRDIQWPIRCKASMDDSGCGVDNSRLDKLIADTAKAKAKEKLEEKIDEEIGKHLGDELSDALKGLFR